MRKIGLLFTLLLMLTTVTYAGSINKYSVNDEVVESLFSAANEFDYTNLDFNFEVGMNTLSQLEGEKSKTTAGILAIFLGSLGIHRLYLGSPFKVWGIYCGITVCGSVILVGPVISGVLGIIDAVKIFQAEDAAFQEKWVGSEKFINWKD